MKKLLILPLLFLCLNVFAQEKYDYVIISQVAASKTMFNFGSENELKAKELSSKFKNLVDAMHYLQEEGWELYTFTAALDGMITVNQALMRKQRIE